LLDGTTVSHVYDIDGNRVQTKVTPAGGGTPTVTNYLVDTTGNLSQVVAETDGAGALKALYVRAYDELLAVLRPTGTTTWASRFAHSDGLGSARVLTDETGSVTDTRGYEAFGVRNEATGSDPLAFGFAGEPFEALSKLAYHRARWMDPRVGRFVGMDPFEGFIGTPLSLHKFLYAADQPTNATDPTGEMETIGSLGATVTMGQILSTMATVGMAAKAAALVCSAEMVASAFSNDPTGSPCQIFGVRLQAQGGGLERSVKLGPRPTFPFTVAEGVEGLVALKLQLNRRQLDEREDQFRRAERYIRSGPPYGLGPPGNHFGGKTDDSIRVDVEIWRGINFKN